MRKLKLFFEFLALAVSSVLAGFSIASLVHYVSFGVHDYGFGRDAIELALFEGGITGVVFAIPTGAVIYYGALKRHVTPKQTTIILLGSLAGGILLATANPFMGLILTPIWTVAIAVHLKRRMARNRESAPSTWLF